MPIRKVIRLACPLLSVLCLGAGFAATPAWMAALVTVFALLAWLCALQWPFGFPAEWALILSVILAGAGLLSGAAPVWMLFAATLALAGWDILLWDRSLAKAAPAAGLTLLERKHYQSLAAAVGVGLLVLLSGRWLRFQLSFGWMVLLALLALFSLERIRKALAG
jgi:hypothetical protein